MNLSRICLALIMVVSLSNTILEASWIQGGEVSINGNQLAGETVILKIETKEHSDRWRSLGSTTKEETDGWRDDIIDFDRYHIDSSFIKLEQKSNSSSSPCFNDENMDTYQNSSNIVIGELHDVTNPETRHLYDVYNGAITSYDNRLLVSNDIKTEELRINADGTLDFINFFDYSSPIGGFVIGNKFILPKITTVADVGLYFFDLTIEPMELISFVQLPGSTYPIDRNNLFFNDIYTFIKENNGDRIHLINNDTLINEGYITGLGYGYYECFNDNFIHLTHTNNGLRLNIFKLTEHNDFQINTTLDINGFGSNWGQISIVDDKVIIVTVEDLLIIDISDISNPYISNTISHRFFSFEYSYPYVFGCDRDENIVVFESDENEVYHLIDLKSGLMGPLVFTNLYNVHYVEPYLFLNCYYEIIVIDVINDFEIVNYHGSIVWFPSTFFNESDMYYMENDYRNGRQEIFSLLDNTIVATLNYKHIRIPFMQDRFSIINDRLYFSYINEGQSFFDIYNIENQETILINRVIFTQHPALMIKIINNKAFFGDNNKQVFVYDISGDELDYVGLVNGRINDSRGYHSKDFFLNLNNRNLIIRDINQIDNILYQTVLNTANDESYIVQYDDSHFFLMNSDNARLFHFDINAQSSQQISSFTSYNLNTINNVISTTLDSYYSHNQTYRALHGDQIVRIGAKNFSDRHIHVSDTYFFPERGKMVIAATGGIWVYDIHYEEYVADESDIIVEKNIDRLYSNYPNPFNPETTISFILHSETHVRLDIYNIRGQKVKSLVNDIKTSGNHQVIWNGTDESGLSVSSGIYFCKMLTSDFVSTKKMVLLK